MSVLTGRCLELLPDARLAREVDNDDRELMVLGPPGAGKTRSLGVLLDAHLQAGLPPDQMLVNAFTRNATAVLRGRLAGEYGLTDPEMPWVRTIHSSCFQLLRLRSEQVMNLTLLRKFGDDTGYELKGVLNQRTLEDPYAVGSVETLGDWCFIAEELRRVSRRQVRENWSFLHLKNPTAEPWSIKDARDFSATYSKWKGDNGLYDFTDMLELVIKHRLRPPVRWIWLDEAQDMTPLQWEVVDLWLQEANRMLVFGDENQAIFSWAGADPAVLRARNAHWLTLSHSYRLPSRVHAEAQQIIGRVEERIVMDFEPHTQGGSVERIWDWDDLQVGDESWLMLVRNRAFADKIRMSLSRAAVPFYDRTSPAGIPAANSPRGQALAVLMELNGGGVVRGGRLRLLQRQTYHDDWPDDRITYGQSYSVVDLHTAGAVPGFGLVVADTPLKAIRLDTPERAYLNRVLERHGPRALVQKPRVEVSTIHGAKGEEADHVAVSTAMTRRTRREYEEDPDSENRVYYVGCTRARKSVVWVVDGPGWELVR